MWDFAIAGVIVVAAVGYAAWQVFRHLTGRARCSCGQDACTAQGPPPRVTEVTYKGKPLEDQKDRAGTPPAETK